MEEAHPLSRYPNEAWRQMVESGSVSSALPPLVPDACPSNHIRCVCISDTHCKLGEYLHKIPEGDILICAGDFTNDGSKSQIVEFNNQLGNLGHKHKIVVAGNHDRSFDSSRLHGDKDFDPVSLLTNCTYLADEGVELYGYRFYGSPWMVGGPLMAFALRRGSEALVERRNAIPPDTDVLITHTPPLGHGDFFAYPRLATWIPFWPWEGRHLGDVDLLCTIEERVKPLYHVFGHVHEGHGVTTNGDTIFINAAACTRSLIRRPTQPPITFDLPLKSPTSSLPEK